MTRYIVDSYAWIEYLRGSSKGEIVRKIIEDKNNDIFTVMVSVAEIISVARRENRDHDAAFKYIMALSKIMEIDCEVSKEAGLFHAEKRKKIKDFGLSDAFIAVVAEKMDANILTGDPHFKGIKNVIFL